MGADLASLRGPLSAIPSVGIAHVVDVDSRADTDLGLPSDTQLFGLVIDGLGFDLAIETCDLARLRAAGVPRNMLEALRPHEGRNALSLVPGPHIAAAAHTLAIMRVLMDLGARVALAVPGLEQVVWPPAEWSVDPAEFARLIAPWTAGGAFPAPGLVQFRSTLDGSVQSAGLAHLTGQELRVDGPIAGDPSHAHRLAARLVDMLIHRGRLARAEQFVGPSGEQLRLEPSVNGRYVRARLG